MKVINMKHVKIEIVTNIKKIKYINKEIPETTDECDDMDCFDCAYCKYYPMLSNICYKCVHRKLLKDIRS